MLTITLGDLTSGTIDTVNPNPGTTQQPDPLMAAGGVGMTGSASDTTKFCQPWRRWWQFLSVRPLVVDYRSAGGIAAASLEMPTIVRLISAMALAFLAFVGFGSSQVVSTTPAASAGQRVADRTLRGAVRTPGAQVSLVGVDNSAKGLQVTSTIVTAQVSFQGFRTKSFVQAWSVNR